MEQLTALDASFVYLETASAPMHIGAVAIYDPSTAPGGFVRFKDILGLIGSRLDRAKSFRQKLVRVPLDLDHPYWIEDSEFDLEYHVRHIALPKPGDWRQFCITVARIHSRPLDMTKPLWELWVVEGLDNIPDFPPGSFAMISKVHHAAIDGASGVEMTAAIHDLTPDVPMGAGTDNWAPEKKPSIAELGLRGYINSVRQPFRFAETLLNTIPGFVELRRQIKAGSITAPDSALVAKTRFNKTLTPHRSWDGVRMPLADIREIKQSLDGATVNDVVLTIIAGALRKYLSEKGELPVESLSIMVPISVRDEKDKKSLGNQVSAMIVKGGTHIEDPFERLAFVQSATVNSKALTNAIGAKTLSDYSTTIPAGLFSLGARLYTQLGLANSHRPAFNCVATNVPGSRVPLYFAGAQMVTMMGTGPIQDGMGLINSIFSYGDSIAISFTADRQMIPDPAEYAKCIREAFEELKSSATAIDRSKVKSKRGAVTGKAKRPAA